MVKTLVGDKFDRFNEILNSPNQGQDFSTLAWRFNNLNSTAKMLLVGASSQNVPFIPISDLNKSQNTAGQEVYRGDYLINLNKARLKTEAPLELISISPPPPVEQTVSEALEYKPVLKPFNNLGNAEKTKADFLPIFREEKNVEAVNDLENYKPSFLPSQTQREILTPQVKPNHRIPEDKLFNLKENEIEIEREAVQEEKKQSDFQNTYFNSKYQEPKAKTNWSYPVEENYYEIRDPQDKKENPIGNLIKQAAKSAAVLSLLALLGLGTYNLYNSWQKNKNPNLEKNNASLGDFAESETSTTTNTTSSSKTFFEEDSVNNSTNTTTNNPASPLSEKGNYEPVKIKPSDYKPTIKPKTNNSSKSKKINKTNTYSPTFNISKASKTPSVPPILPYDYSTVYDSSAEKAIDPNTYTGIKFPLEVSYTKASDQTQADLNTINNSSASDASDLQNTQAIQNSNNINMPEASSQFTQTAKPIETNQIVERSNEKVSEIPEPEQEKVERSIKEPGETVERVENNYPIRKSYSESDDLTSDEKAILDSSDEALPENKIPSANSENKPSDKTDEFNNLPSPGSKVSSSSNNNYVTAPSIQANPADSQLSQEEMEDLDQSLEDKTFSAPILRSPFKQSQSVLENNSPYTVDGSKSSSNIALPNRKYYSRPTRARINRTFSTPPTNNSQTDFSVSKYQDQVQNTQNLDYSSPAEAYPSNDEITNGVYLRQSPYQNANLSSL